MNCEACLKQLQTAEDPGNPGTEAAAHLAACLLCREWQRQLLQIEHHVRRLPVPGSSPETFLRQRLFKTEPKTLMSIPFQGPSQDIVTESPSVIPLPTRDTAPAATPAHGSLRRRFVTGGIAVAAACVLIACGIFLGNFVSRAFRDNGQQAKRPEPPSDKKDKDAPRKVMNPLVAKVLESDLNLAATSSPVERVKHLAQIATALDEETRRYMAAGPQVEKLTRLYDKVIQQGVVERARTLPRDQRREVLTGIVEELEQAGKRAELRAREAGGPTAQSFTHLAKTARSGAEQLRELMEEASE